MLPCHLNKEDLETQSLHVCIGRGLETKSLHIYNGRGLVSKPKSQRSTYKLPTSTIFDVIDHASVSEVKRVNGGYS